MKSVQVLCLFALLCTSAFAATTQTIGTYADIPDAGAIVYISGSTTGTGDWISLLSNNKLTVRASTVKNAFLLTKGTAANTVHLQETDSTTKFYVSAEENGKKSLRAVRTHARSWETFNFVSLGTNQFALSYGKTNPQFLKLSQFNTIVANGADSSSGIHFTFYNKVVTFVGTSSAIVDPTYTLSVPTNYKVIGGGAKAATGNFLTASNPTNDNKWYARAIHHQSANVATTLTVYAIAVFDPSNLYDVAINTAVSAVVAHPTTSVTVTAGYTLTGGGASSSIGGAGSLLTASYPSGSSSWAAASKDHQVADNEAVTAYAIGIKRSAGSSGPAITNTVVSNASGSGFNPSVVVTADPTKFIVGGGAYVNYQEPGVLLVETYPNANGWTGVARDEGDNAQATITTYAVQSTL